ncbi:MAG TPA: hypothetical protein VKM54_20650 [Myxococcota bacterium]|nr:hypothetical protein [Myxococcota bacterium]
MKKQKLKGWALAIDGVPLWVGPGPTPEGNWYQAIHNETGSKSMVFVEDTGFCFYFLGRPSYLVRLDDEDSFKVVRRLNPYVDPATGVSHYQCELEESETIVRPLLAHGERFPIESLPALGLFSLGGKPTDTGDALN